MSYPISDIREQFPALRRTLNGRQVAYLDGPGGSQTVQGAIDAITRFMIEGGANLHGAFPTSRETEAVIAGARERIADLFGTTPNEVAFGSNMTTLTFGISRALSRNWSSDDEIVVTELDHRANVDPWLQAAQDAGATVRWLRVDPETLCLDLSDLDSVVNTKTRLVAIGLASNAVGTVSDVARVSARAHYVGALVAVDAVHAAPHLPIDRDALGIDILLCSAYKFFGPHVGVAVIRPDIFETLPVYRLQPAPNYFPDKLETGTQNHEGIAGIAPAIDFFASLGSGSTTRDRIRSGLQQIENHENRLATMMRAELADITGVRVYSAGSSVAKTPTIAFTLESTTPRIVCERLSEEFGIFAANGDFYASTLAERLGITGSGAWIRVGLAPYSTDSEAERLIDAISQISKTS